jgi:hypothetical protein
LTLNGAATYTGSTAVTSSGIVFNNNATPTTSGFTGAGAVTIQPTTSFSSTFIPSYTYANTLTGLTLGSSGNTANIYLPNDINIAGPIAVGGRIVGVLGNLTSTGNVSLTSASNTLLAGNVSAGGTFTVNSSGSFLMGTNLSTAAGVTITANGGFSSTGSGTNYLTGNLTTSGTPISFTGPVQVANFNGGANPLTLSTGGGNISLSGAVSNFSGTAQNYAVLMASNLYDGVTASTVTGSSSDIFLSYSAGTGLFLNQWGLPTLSYLLVGGGGGGGGSYVGQFTGGGGGGGGVAAGTYTLSSSYVNIGVGAAGTTGSSGNSPIHW